MGWGGKGKGYWHHHHHPHHHHGIGGAVAEVALIGGAAVAGAAVATAVAGSRKPPPRTEVVVVPNAVPSGAVLVEAPPRPAPVAPVVGVLAGGAVGAAACGPPGALVGAAVGAAATSPPWGPKGKGKGKWKGPPVTVAPMPPLAVSAIGIPAAGIEQKSGVTYFGVEVMPETGATYRLQKRYNEFDALKDRLARIAPASTIDRGFPPKHLFSCEGAKLEERRHGLEQWLKGALNHPNGRGAWCLELRDFLEVGQIHTLAPGMVAESPAVSAPPAPEGQALKILVPDGVVAGQVLAVTVPDGRQLNFTVPAGFPPGSELELWFDPAAGSLSPLVQGPTCPVLPELDTIHTYPF